jgi:hypothetical protein
MNNCATIIFFLCTTSVTIIPVLLLGYGYFNYQCQNIANYQQNRSIAMALGLYYIMLSHTIQPLSTLPHACALATVITITA